MHDSDYRNVCRLKLIHDAEGKSLNEASPDRAAREQASRIAAEVGEWQDRDRRYAGQRQRRFLFAAE
jgi:hypothetical protein